MTTMNRSLNAELDAELRSTRQCLLNFWNEQKSTGIKLRKLEDELSRLSKERDCLMAQRWSLQEHSIRPAVPPYSKAWNRTFFGAIRTWLPRELRDMVYAYLWDEVSLGKYSFMTRAIISPSLGEHGASEYDLDWVRREEHPHFIKPAYVGPDAALEIVEAWYKAIGVEDKHPFVAYNGQYLERLVTSDAFHVELNPADVLRKLDLKLGMEDLALPHGTASETSRTIAEPDLNILMKIKNKSGFKLNLALQQQTIRLNLWPQAFESCRTVWQAFTSEGAHVRIYWSYTDPYAPQIERELDVLFAEPKLDWKESVIEDLEAEPDIRKRDRHYKYEDLSDYKFEDYADTGSEDDDFELWTEANLAGFHHELAWDSHSHYDYDYDDVHDYDGYDDIY